ncbi:hypothetical protein M758_7G096400 [Ceratodon purpureus]|nr:hypothetical protein M758_7G096400 [Ceratodon purpureus]
MRGVDVVDLKRQEYTTQLHSHKWWHRVFMFILDNTLLNAYVLYAEDQRARGLPLFTRALWHYTLAEALIRPRLRAGHIRGPIRNLAARVLHVSEAHGSLRRRCVVCQKRTRRMCGGCAGRFMCEGRCYRVVHTQPGYHANLGN